MTEENGTLLGKVKGINNWRDLPTFLVATRMERWIYLRSLGSGKWPNVHKVCLFEAGFYYVAQAGIERCSPGWPGISSHPSFPAFWVTATQMCRHAWLCIWSLFAFFFSVMALNLEPLHTVGKSSTTKLYLKFPFWTFHFETDLRRPRWLWDGLCTLCWPCNCDSLPQPLE